MEIKLNQIKFNCSVHYWEDSVSQTEHEKVLLYLKSYKKNKLIYCPSFIRGVCIFPSNICPYAHSSKDLEFINLKGRNKNDIFYHIDKNVKIKFCLREYPRFILLHKFQKENFKNNEPICTLEEIEFDWEKRYRLREVYQKEIIKDFFQFLLVKIGSNFFLAKNLIENEIRRVKIKKVQANFFKMLEIANLCVINTIIPPLLVPIEIVINEKEKINFEIVEKEENDYFDLRKANSEEEKMKTINSYLQKVSKNKKILCENWGKGYCIFDEKDCPYAHGIDNLNYCASFKNNDDFFPKIKVSEKNYKHLYNYQIILQNKKTIDESQISTLKNINEKKSIRKSLRNLMIKEEGEKLLNLLFENHKSVFLTKSFVERQSKNMNFFIKINSLFNSDICYETKIPIPPRELNNKESVIILVDKNICLDDYFKNQILSTFEQMALNIKTEKNPMDYITISQITKSIYKNSDYLDPPLNYYLKSIKISLYEFIIQHNLYKYDKPTLLNPIDEDKIIIQEIQNEFKKFFYEDKTKSFLKKQNKLLEHLLTNKFLKFFEQNLKIYLDKVLSNHPTIFINKHLYIFNKNMCSGDGLNFKRSFCFELFNEMTEDKQKINEKINNESDKKITIIDDIESFQKSRNLILQQKLIGIDLEGKLELNGFINLIQVGFVNEKNENRIIIFDILQIKKDLNLFSLIKNYLQTIFHDITITKIFHDCKRDCVALHLFMDICPQNIIDISAVHTFLEQLESFFFKKKNDVHNFKSPGLNEILNYYHYDEGENHLKKYMKEKFKKEDKKYFFDRPINPDFLEYSAKDVEGLNFIYHKLIERTNNFLLKQEIDSGFERIKKILEKVSLLNSKEGCRKMKDKIKIPSKDKIIMI